MLYAPPVLTRVVFLCCMALAVQAMLCVQPLAARAATANIELTSPDRVARGDGFMASATANSPVKALTFVWRGKSYAVPTSPVANVQGGAVQASLFLPMPLDVKETSLRLTVKSGLAGADAPKPAQVQVAVYDKKRPVQKLTVDKKYTSPPAHEMERIKADRERVAKVVALYSPTLWDSPHPFLRPVPGIVTSAFGLKRVYNGIPKSVHRGLDMRGAMGTPVRAAGDGQVALADGLYYSGNAIYIDHGLGVVTSYMHMSKLEVQPGQMVKRGDIIGRVGSTGQSTGPHLHLGLMLQGTAVDPVPFLSTVEDAPAPVEKRNL